VGLSKLVLMPGERADVIIDFAGLPVGTQLVLRNVARAPYPAGATPNGKTIGRIMQFRVVAPAVAGQADTSYNPAAPTIPLRNTPIPRLVNPATGTPTVVPDVKRQLTLNEVMGLPCTIGPIMYPGGPLEVLVNNTKYMGDSTRNDPGGLQDFTAKDIYGVITYYSEFPKEGDTELWEFINLTADAHPMHFHLTQVQLLNRQNFDLKKYNAAYAAAFPGGMMIDGFGPPKDYNVPNALPDGAIGGNPGVTPFLKGAIIPPNPNEAGWKDTIMVLPGQVTRIMVRYAPTDTTVGVKGAFPFDPNHGHGYVVHCHIVDHEDNEMMRPFSVLTDPKTPRTYVAGTDY
jgi:FtsP/CotA-like multicopper oxidase with cupredoxin domain